MKNIVVKGCDFSVDDIPFNGVSITSPASITNKCDGKASYSGDIVIAVTNWIDDGIAQGTGVGTLSGSAKKTKIDDKNAVLEGDDCDVILSGVDPKSGSPVTGYSVKVKITGAGQIKGKGV